MHYIVDGDDLCDKTMDEFCFFIDDMLSRFAYYKFTAFTIPGMMSDSNCKYITDNYADSVQLALHGDVHSKLECRLWTKQQAIDSITNHFNRGHFIKGFKPPYWVSSSGLEEALVELDFWMAIGKHPSSDNLGVISGLKIYGISSNSRHGHISNYNGGLTYLRLRMNKLPYNTNFKFASESITRGK